MFALVFTVCFQLSACLRQGHPVTQGIGIGHPRVVADQEFIPRFSVRRFNDATLWGSVDLHDLTSHPAYTDSDDEAQFIFAVMGPTADKYLDDLHRLPVGKPWVVWGHYMHAVDMGKALERFHSVGQQFHSERQSSEWVVKHNKTVDLVRRQDLFWVGYDLRDYDITNDTVAPLHGVTFPPCGFPRQSRPALASLDLPASYFLTFRGDSDGRVRKTLGRTFSHSRRPGVQIEVVSHRGPYTQYDKDRYDDLLNTSYALLPRGGGRWESRLQEILGACTIPVIMADGLTLPFDNFVDWTSFSVRVNDSLAEDPDALLAALPRDPALILQMRRRACSFYDRYVSSMERRINALLLALNALQISDTVLKS